MALLRVEQRARPMLLGIATPCQHLIRTSSMSVEDETDGPPVRRGGDHDLRRERPVARRPCATGAALLTRDERVNR